MTIAAVMFSLALAASAASSPTGPAGAFDPGEPMRFPLRSEGVVEDLVRLYGVNCRSAEAEVASGCLALLEQRGASCAPKPPEVFETRQAYAAWAKGFAACLMPRPLCAGREVASIDECGAQGANRGGTADRDRPAN